MPRYQDIPKLPTTSLGARYRPPTVPPYEDMKRRKGKRPQTHVVTLGETYPDIAEKYDVEATQLMQGAENLTPIPGTAVTIPDRSGLMGGGTYPETGLSVTPGYTPESKARLGLETAATTDVGLRYPTGWNPAQVLASTEYGSMDFYSKFYGGYYTEYGGLGAEAPLDYRPTKTARGWGRPISPPDADLYGTPTEALPEIPGIPSSHAWEKTATGAWERKPQEAVFDALYEMNDIDPTDPDMVEWFWSNADEDLLGVGILFDVLDWGGEGGGAGGGYAAPSVYGTGAPSRMYGAGQRPVRGEYASYLGLTSWRI